MYFSAINAAIKEEMQLDPGLVSEAERARFINDGMKKIAELQLIELSYLDPAASTQYPTMPIGLTKIRNLYWNDIPLRSLKPAQAEDLDTTGTPIGYVWEAEVVRLYPIPVVAGELRWTYTGTPADCTTTDLAIGAVTLPNLPTLWHPLLVDYACHRSHRKNGNILMSREYKNDFTIAMANTLRTYISSLNSQIVTADTPEEAISDEYTVPFTEEVV